MSGIHSYMFRSTPTSSYFTVSLDMYARSSLVELALRDFPSAAVCRCRIHSMEFYLELHVFGVIPVRKKMKLLTKGGIYRISSYARALIGRTDRA